MIFQYQESNVSMNLHNITPTRIRNQSKYQSNDRNYSLESLSNSSNRDLIKVPSLESLNNISHTPSSK